MKIEIRNSRPAIVTDRGQTVLDGIYAGTKYWGNMWNVLKDYKNKEWSLEQCAPFTDGGKNFSVLGNAEYYIARCDNAVLYTVLSESEALIRTEVTNNSDIEKDPFDVVAFGGVFGERLESAVFNGTTDINGVRSVDMSSEAGVRIFADGETLVSPVNMTVKTRYGKDIHIGFVSFEHYFGGTYACEDGHMEARLYIDGRKIAPGKTVCSDWVRISVSGDGAAKAMTDYAEFVRDFLGIKNRFDHAPVGFSTWYYYMSNIDERTIYENVETCEKIRSRVPLEVFQIDAGWGSYYESEGNIERFPRGMKYYADYIREHGMMPGIWVSPFNFPKDGELCKNHPEYFVRDTEGNIKIVRDSAVLDATHPGAREFIRDAYKRITEEWGYRYLKIDIVSDFLTSGVYYEEGAGPLQSLRAYFRTVRESCPDDTFILACTCPLFEIAEYVDGVRIAVDIFERWESLTKEFHRIFPRFYTNGILYWNDPDCLMIRKSENEDDDCRRYCSRTDLEIRTYETAMYAAGGALLISDKLPLMNERQINDYSLYFPHRDSAAVPLDIERAYLPSVLDCGTQDGVRTVAFINWGESERSLNVTLDGEYTAREHWDGLDLGSHKGSYTVTLAPHESQLVHFTPKK